MTRQNDKEFVILSIAKNPKKFRYTLKLWIATQIFAKFARNDGGFCHFEPFVKRRPSGLQGASRSKKSTKPSLKRLGFYANNAVFIVKKCVKTFT